MAYITPKGVADLMAHLARSAKRRKNLALAKKIESAAERIEEWADHATRFKQALWATPERRFRGLFSLDTELTERIQQLMEDVFPETGCRWGRAENTPDGTLDIIVGALGHEIRKRFVRLEIELAKFDLIKMQVDQLRSELVRHHLLPPKEVGGLVGLNRFSPPFESLNQS